MSDAKDYITKKEIPQLFECLMTGLMYQRPSDHVAYLQDCLAKIKARGVTNVRWDLFLEAKKSKSPLPPVTPPRGSRPSSRASSKAESLFDKKPILPPISAPIAAASGSSDLSAAQHTAAQAKLLRPLDQPVLLVIGGPGSGRQRVAKAIAERYNFCLVGVGGLLKSEPRAADAVASGELAPDALALSALVAALNAANADGVGHRHRGYVIEGYPRSLGQLEDYLEQIHRIDHALLLDYEESSLHERLLHGRSGGVAEIARRLNAFKAACLPACRALDDEGKLLVLPVDPGASDAAVADEAAQLLDSVLGGVDSQQHQQQHQQHEEAAAEPPAPVAAAPHSGVVAIRRIADLAPTTNAASRGSDEPPLILVMGGPGSGRTTCLERLARLCPSLRRIDAADCGDGAAEVAARLKDHARDGGEVLVLEGFPETEAGLRAMYAEIGAPDLALLIDCHEPEMLQRLAKAAVTSAEEASLRMVRFKEETLPVVQHFDEAGRLCIVLGDTDPDSVLKEVKSLIDCVAFADSEAASRVSAANQAAANNSAAALKARRLGSELAASRTSGAAEADEEAIAAARIQAGFRGYQTRKQLAQSK